MSPSADPGWFTVRCVVVHGAPGDDGYAYEERITLWRARTVELAIERAEHEARQYAVDLGDATVLEFAQSYALPDPPRDGAEVLSLIRLDPRGPDAYLDAVLDTGTELQTGAVSAVPATVLQWDDEAGWGVCASLQTPGGCWVHFSVVQVPGLRRLRPGDRVQLVAERADQDGYPYRAVGCWPVDAAPVHAQDGAAAAYRSSLRLTFDPDVPQE